MTFYIYIPHWFLGIDSILELFTIITSLLIAVSAFRTYKYFYLKKYKNLALAFILIAISFTTKIISNLIFLIPIKKQIQTHFFTLTYTTLQKITIIDNLAFFIHKLTLLSALLTLYFIITHENKKEHITITFLLIALLSFLINSYLLFNFLIIIFSEYLYIINYIRNKHKKSSTINLLLLGLSISYFLIFLAFKANIFYFFGELALTITFLTLLARLLKTFKK